MQMGFYFIYENDALSFLEIRPVLEQLTHDVYCHGKQGLVTFAHPLDGREHLINADADTQLRISDEIVILV
jgi:hypothetical protein